MGEAEANKSEGGELMGNPQSNAPSIANSMLGAIHATNATDATDETRPRPGRNRSVPDAPTPVDNPESSTPTTPTGVPIIRCDVCGVPHPVWRRHCAECGRASAFINPAGYCLTHGEDVPS